MTAKIHPFEHSKGLPRIEDAPFRLGLWLVQPDRNTIADSAAEIRLHPKAMEVLVALAARAPDVVSRDELIRTVWGGAFVGEEVLTGNIQELRKALGDDAKHPHVIETVPKRGYRLMVAVTSPTSGVEGRPEDVTLPARRIPFGVYPVAASVAVAAALAIWLSRRSADEGVAPPPRSVRYVQLTTDPGEASHPSLSPEGEFVVYSRKTQGRWNIYRQRLLGETAFNLTESMAADALQPAFSPYGERIAFRSELEGSGIFVVGATGESVQRVTDFGFDPAWSPDGTRLAVSTLRFLSPYLAERGPGVELRIVDVTTGETQLAIEGRALQPSWSPNGDRIAFWGIERNIWTFPAEGGEMVRVTDDHQQWRNWNPVWSPDGRYLYFASNRGGSMNLWRIPVEETTGRARGASESITIPAREIGSFSMARNVQTIAFTSITAEANVFALAFDPDSERVQGEPIPITRGSRLVVAPQPSPDGESLVAWTSMPDEGIVVVGQDGSNLRKMPVAPGSRFPRWSSDGQRIVFNARATPDSPLEAWTIGADGDGLRQVTDSSSQPIVVEYPFLVPDGTHILVGATDAVLIFPAARGDRRSPRVVRVSADPGRPRRRILAVFIVAGRGVARRQFRAGRRTGHRNPLPRVGVADADDRFRSVSRLARRLPARPLQWGGADGLQAVPRGHRRDSRDLRARWGVGPHPESFKDNRAIFYTHRRQQSDIWVLSLDPAN